MWLLSIFYHRPQYNNWSQRQTIGTNQSLKHFSFISVHLQSIWDSYDIVLWYSTYLQRNLSRQGAHQAHRQLKTGCRKGYIIHESHFWTQINAEHNTPLVLPQRTSACVSPITSCRKKPPNLSRDCTSKAKFIFKLWNLTFAAEQRLSNRTYAPCTPRVPSHRLLLYRASKEWERFWRMFLLSFPNYVLSPAWLNDNRINSNITASKALQSVFLRNNYLWAFTGGLGYHCNISSPLRLKCQMTVLNPSATRSKPGWQLCTCTNLSNPA